MHAFEIGERAIRALPHSRRRRRRSIRRSATQPVNGMSANVPGNSLSRRF